MEDWTWKAAPQSLTALDADSGKELWSTQSPVVPLTLAMDGSRVCFHDGTKVLCLDRCTGRPQWQSPPIARAAKIYSWFAPTLVLYQDVVLFAGAEKMERHRGGKDSMTALSAKTGKILWTAEHPPSGYDSPEDLLIIDGLVWTAPLTNRNDSGQYVGRDVHTGEVRRTFPCDCGQAMPHHRCHRAKATDKYILASRTGIEYVDLASEHWNRNDWVRGACLYGIMPANGLTYAPPQSSPVTSWQSSTGSTRWPARAHRGRCPAKCRSTEGWRRGRPTALSRIPNPRCLVRLLPTGPPIGTTPREADLLRRPCPWN